MSWWSKHVKPRLSGGKGLTAWATGGMSTLFDVQNQHLNDFKDWYDGTAAQRKANRMNIENWNLQNAYNTPAAQMQRYLDAGLNPNLIYSQSNEAGSIASVSPAQSGSEVLSKAAQTIASFFSIAGMIANVKNLQQQNKNLKSQDNLLSAQADYTSEMARRYGYETDWLQQNGTSSFDSPTIRSGKSLAHQYADSFGSWLGGQSGKLINGPGTYVLKAIDFDSEDEIKSVFRELSKQGAIVEVDWSGWDNRYSSRYKSRRRFEHHTLTY